MAGMLHGRQVQIRWRSLNLVRSVERSNAAGSGVHASKSRRREWWGRELRGRTTPLRPPLPACLPDVIPDGHSMKT